MTDNRDDMDRIMDADKIMEDGPLVPPPLGEAPRPYQMAEDAAMLSPCPRVEFIRADRPPHFGGPVRVRFRVNDREEWLDIIQTDSSEVMGLGIVSEIQRLLARLQGLA